MKCPFCKFDNDRVADTRATPDGLSIRRRRICSRCGRRFTTYERIEEIALKVFKKDETRVPYRREKIRKGIERACWKRPISDSQIDAAVEEIENVIFANFATEVDSHQIGEAVLKNLRTLDQVAFIRFASVYREFNSLNDFVETLRALLAEEQSHSN